jgi:hypothetical protein
MRVEAVEKRLVEWAAWFNAGGSSCDGGWPVKNILHASWLPPSGGATPCLPAGRRADTREREMHRAIGLLSDRMIAALVVHYCKRWSLADQAEALACSEAAVSGRIARAHQHLAVRLAGGITEGVFQRSESA